jgi:hypothetical protein
MPDFTSDDIERATGRPYNRAMSSRTDWRFGKKGAFSVDPDQAVWHDFETGEGGTVSALIGRRVAYTAPTNHKPDYIRKRWSPAAAKLWSGSK